MSERDWQIHVRDMLKSCDRVLQHTAGLDRSTVLETPVAHDAIMWNISILGEAANQIPIEVRRAKREIPWRAIIDARNRIIHWCGRIDEDVAWDIISEDIPNLVPQLHALLEQAGN